MSKPIRATTDWAEPYEPDRGSGDPPPAEQITRPGRHHAQDWIKNNAEVQQDRRARYLRNYGGRKKDARRIPPDEAQLSARTSKSSSKIRFPSAAFRRNYDLIRWDH